MVLVVLVATHNVRGSVAVLSALVMGVVSTPGRAPFDDLRLNFLNFIALPITFGIGCEHPLNIYDRSRIMKGDVTSAVKRSGDAVMLCSCTTIIGYGSLLVSDQQAVASFGSLAVVRELACVAMAVACLPALLHPLGAVYSPSNEEAHWVGALDPGAAVREENVEEILRRSLRIVAALSAVSALTSATFFHPDEHHQVVEFAGLKLGFTRPDELPWEYAAQIRPWLQPALYTLLGRALFVIGVTDRFLLLAVFRLATAALAVAALARLSRVAVRELPSDRTRRAYAAMLTWIGFFLYLFARTSSETLSGACLAVAVSLAWDMRTFGWLEASACGVFIGLAFEARFQSGFASVGLVAWLAVVRRVSALRLGGLVGGGVLVLACAAVVDRWGYGAWVFPPLAYVRENLVHGVANSFGRDPVWAYPVLVVVNVFAPLAVSCVAAVGVAALRFPRHVSTFVVVPFVVAHSLVAHKEERFLFPLAFLVPTLLALAFVTRREGPLLPRALRASLALALAVMVAQLVRPLGFRAQFHFARVVAALPLAGEVVVALPGSEHPRYPFFLTSARHVEPLTGAWLPVTARWVYGESPALALPPSCDGAPLAAEVIASDLPFAPHTPWAEGASTFMDRWNGLCRRGLPLPWLHFATLARVIPPR